MVKPERGSEIKLQKEENLISAGEYSVGRLTISKGENLMKGKTKSILGVALTLMLMVSLLMWTAPVSAGNTLQFDAEDIPEELVDDPGDNIVDIAVGGDGAVIYAVIGSSTLYVSTDTGESWEKTYVKVDSTTINAVFVAVSPDDPQYIAAADAAGTVYISDDSGVTWDDLGDSGITTVNDIAISVESGGSRWIAVAGVIVAYYEIGAIGAAWTEASIEGGFTPAGIAGAVAFSPNFASDEILTAVTALQVTNLETGPSGIAAWSEESTVGSHSIFLSDEGVGYTSDSDYGAGRVVIPEDPAIEFATISTLSYWFNYNDPVTAYPDAFPYMILALDTTVSGALDGVADAWLVMATSDSYYSPTEDTWTQAVPTGGSVSDHWIGVGDAGGLETDDSTLATFQANTALDAAAKAVVLEVKVAVGEWHNGTYDAITAYVDDIVIGAVTYTLEPDDALFLASGDINFQMFSFNHNKWNSAAGFTDFPVAVVEDGADAIVDTLDSASISLSPDYLGSDDDMRVAFVGITTIGGASGDEADGIFRLDNDDVEVLKDEENIHSVDFDGTKLVAGGFDDTTVYRSDDPLASSPDVSGSTSRKSPGGDGLTVVAFADDSVVAGTSGDESSFSVSRNSGETFNDISLIDTDLDVLSDVAVSADGSVIYLVTAQDTSNDMSLWRYADDVWERVLSEQEAGADFIVRLAPDDPDVVYLAEVGDTNIFYTDDAGLDRWRPRTSTEVIFDLAVETDGSVSYVLTTSGYVSKSINTCFTWGGKETTGQAGSNMIVSLGEDLVLVGGDTATPAVSYSTDGNESWTDLDELDDAGDVQVTASGLADGDFIYAATTGGGTINRWEIGNGEWDDFYDEVTAGSAFTGIGLAEGTLYAVAFDTDQSELYRFIDPTDGDVSIETASLVDVELSNTPSALRVSAGSVVLWAIGVDTDAGDQKLYSYEDTIALVGPTLKGPKSGFEVPVNEISGDTADVNFSWKSPSDDVTEFDLEVALDDEFDEVIFEPDATQQTAIGGGDEGDTMSFVMVDDDYDLMPDVTYYWRVRVSDDGPVESPWSDTWSITVAEAEGAPPVTIEIPPVPEITVEMPAPEVTVTVPPMVTVPPAPAPTAPGFVWGIIVIGALLVVALIVLIIRTRRVV